MKRQLFFLISLLVCTSLFAQYKDDEDHTDAEMFNPLQGVEYKAEVQGSLSKGKTPFWLNANKYGLSSLEKTNGYVRGSVIRPLSEDEGRKWGLGYGLDVAVAKGYTSRLIIQQTFVEGRWLHGALSIGSKEYLMELKNNELSSGSQTLGRNARPVPQVRLALPEYWIVPYTKGWIRIKGHGAFGKMTDDNWQHEFTDRKTKYADNVLYHSKAGYLMIGNPERYYPLSVELGLEMACTFGGTSYKNAPDGLQEVKNSQGLKDFWHAIVPGGADKVEEGTVYQNASGNQLGSWVARVNYDADTWRLGVYLDKYFEDHSSMLQLDYAGYGTGDEWNVKKDRRYFLYDFKDMMLGAELNLKYGHAVRDIVFEYIYSKYQSGPLYHDHTQGVSDHVCGWDNFYNHYIFTGWQHWGQVIGNPLYRSPIYNETGKIEVENNRFMAFHLGISGSPLECLDYRAMATYQDGLGYYEQPYTKKQHNFSFLLEATYHFKNNWDVTGSYGMDFGKIRGDNTGFQLTLVKSGMLTKSKRTK